MLGPLDVSGTKRVLVNFRKEGYTVFQWPLKVEGGNSYVADAVLKPIDLIAEVDTSVDTMIMVEDEDGDEKLVVEIEGGSLRDDEGNAVLGMVTVELTHGDPIEEPEAFPGGFQATSEVGQEPDLMLESFGYSRFTIRDEDGLVISNIDPQNPATVEMRLPDLYQSGGESHGEVLPGDTIPFWYYNMEEGTWLRQDADPSTPELDDAVVLERDGILFGRGKTSHTSGLNIDRMRTIARGAQEGEEDEKDPLACVDAIVLTEGGKPIRGVRVSAKGINYGFSHTSYTDSDGHACLNVTRTTKSKTFQAEVNASIWVPGEGRQLYPASPVVVTTPTAERSCPDACLQVTIRIPVRPYIEVSNNFTWLNNDNDDRDGQFDLNDDSVLFDDDLTPMNIGIAPPVDGLTASLRVRIGSDKIKLWATPHKQDLSPREFESSDLYYKQVYLEGVAASSAQEDIELELSLEGEPSDPATARFTVLAVEKIEIEGQGNSLTDDDTLDRDPHPNAPAGSYDDGRPRTLRVFPGSRAEVGFFGGVTVGERSNKVTVKVTLNVPAPESNYSTVLYLRPYDVDDPSTSTSPVDPNDAGTVNPCIGAPASNCYPRTPIRYSDWEDNRGQVNRKKSGELRGADRNGILSKRFSTGERTWSTEFTVTSQPGDNFRLAASHEWGFLVRLRNRDDLGDGVRLFDPNVNAEFLEPDKWASPVLTSWRFLHLELDSMAAPGNANDVSGDITGAVTAVGVNCRVRVTNTSRSDGSATGILDELNEFQGGTLTVDGVGYPVVSNSLTRVTVSRVGGACPPATGFFGAFGVGFTFQRGFTLHDDDQDSSMPRAPDTSLLQASDTRANNEFVIAYMRPKFNGGGNPSWDENDVPFDLNSNISAAEVSSRGYFTNWNSKDLNANNYWTVYALSMFQFDINDDGDPNTQSPTLGLNVGWSPTGPDENVVLLPIESYQDAGGCGGLTAIPGRTGTPATTLHEVGHALAGMHTPTDSDGGIMQQGCNKPSTQFTASMINKLRSGPRPGSYDYGNGRFTETP